MCMAHWNVKRRLKEFSKDTSLFHHAGKGELCPGDIWSLDATARAVRIHVLIFHLVVIRLHFRLELPRQYDASPLVRIYANHQ